MSSFNGTNNMSNGSHKPYAVIGAEQLTASVYKTGDELIGFKYRFNITRLNKRTGRVGHWLEPSDIPALIKLTRVLAAELAADGCMDGGLRHQLRTIAARLDDVMYEIKPDHSISGEVQR
jgi:hypothetical protein